MKEGSAEVAGSGWTRIWGGGWRATEPHSAPRRPGVAQYPSTGASCAPSRGRPPPRCSEQPTRRQATLPPQLTSNLQPPPRAALTCLYRGPGCRSLGTCGSLRGGVKYHLSNPQPPSSLILWLNLVPATRWSMDDIFLSRSLRNSAVCQDVCPPSLFLTFASLQIGIGSWSRMLEWFNLIVAETSTPIVDMASYILRLGSTVQSMDFFSNVPSNGNRKNNITFNQMVT